MEPRDAADTVAAHFAAAAVGVIHLHPHVGGGRGAQHDQAVAADTEAAIGDAAGEGPRIGRTHPVGDDIDVVVAAAVHLGECELTHRGRP